MGNCCLPFRFHRTPSAVKPKNVTLLLLGLDNAGKTTIVKRLAGEPIDSVVPTVGFSVILLREKSCHVSIYDLGGGPQIRDIWPRYYADAHGIIFVTDAHDLDKMETCRQILENILKHEEISGKPVLLLANKQDLEGALDEIDIVDRLNLEKIVNDQKCPTLVELCSALNFTKRIDIGIENGYKWLIRSIIRDYPTLNNRVLMDLAKQEEENKVRTLRIKQYEDDNHEVVNHLNETSFKPVKNALSEQNHANGYTDRRSNVKTIATIPGLIDERTYHVEKKPKSSTTPKAEQGPRTAAKTVANSYAEFFIIENFQSDLELLNDVANHTFKNFLVRPKSSGARLYGVKSEKKRGRRRKPLKKSNKTEPSPFTDILKGSETNFLKNGEPPREGFVKNVHPFQMNERIEMKASCGSKSTPNSRRNSVVLAKQRRHSVINGKAVELERFNSTREILLDVTKLSK